MKNNVVLYGAWESGAKDEHFYGNEEDGGLLKIREKLECLPSPYFDNYCYHILNFGCEN